MYLNHLITSSKPSACTNRTIHHKSNFQHHKHKVLQVFKWNKILLITSNQQYSFRFARNEKYPQYVFKPSYNNMQPTCLLQHYNPPQNQFPNHKYRVLQVLKSNKTLFITFNQQLSFTFARNEKHSQYVFETSCNSLQGTYLLQHNKLP